MLRPSFSTPEPEVELLPTASEGLDTVAMEEQVAQGLEIITALEAMNAITDDEHEALESLFHQVATEGISRDDYNVIESVVPGALEGVNPNYLTAHRSMEGTKVALEAIDWKKAGIIAVVVAAVAGLLTKLVQWIASKMGKPTNVKMADRVSKTIEKIYERTDLSNLSEAFNRKNPYKAGSHDFILYENIMRANRHEDFDKLPFIEILAAAMVEHQKKVKVKNFPDEAVYANMDYLLNGMRVAYQEHNYTNETLNRILMVMVGNFIAQNEYNAIENHLIIRPPERNIFSAKGTYIALAQYDYFFLIAERYQRLMNDFSLTVLNTFLKEPVDKVHYEQNASRYNRDIGLFIDDLYKGSTSDVNRRTANAYTKLENRLFDIWEEFQDDPKIIELNKILSGTGSTALFLYDTNQLQGLATNTGSNRKKTFTQRARNETVRFKEDIFINPSPSGMHASETMHQYALYNELINNVKRGPLHDGMIFNLSNYFNERGTKNIKKDGADTAGKIFDVHRYGVVKESAEQLKEARDAIIKVNAHLTDGNYAKRLDKVREDMAECSKMFESWKTSFDGRMFNFITETGTFDSTEPLSRIGSSQFRRTRINIDVTMRAIFTSIRTTAGVLADHTTYLNGIEQHSMTAIQKRAKAADAWNKFAKSGILDKIGKKD